MFKKPKIAFWGTPEFAAGILQALIEYEFNVAAVVTQPDKKIGRKQNIFFSPVKKLAIEKKINVFQPVNLRDIGVADKTKKIGADLFVVAAYGKILSREILSIPKFGAINIHASLLPKYRGASPVQCAILNGDDETGVTLMRMNEKMDEGDILAQQKIKIGKNEKADELLERLERLGSKMIIKFIPDWIEGKIKAICQNNKEVTYCKPVKREDGKIDWNSDSETIFRQWRAYYPWPGVYTSYNVREKSKRLKLNEIAIIPKIKTGETPGKIVRYKQFVAIQANKGLVILKKVQLEGKKEMAIDDLVRGKSSFIGNTLE